MEAFNFQNNFIASSRSLTCIMSIFIKKEKNPAGSCHYVLVCVCMRVLYCVTTSKSVAMYIILHNSYSDLSVRGRPGLPVPRYLSNQNNSVPESSFIVTLLSDVFRKIHTSVAIH